MNAQRPATDLPGIIAPAEHFLRGLAGLSVAFLLADREIHAVAGFLMRNINGLPNLFGPQASGASVNPILQIRCEVCMP